MSTNDEYLERQFQKLINSPFEQLHSNYYHREYSKEEAEALQKKLVAQLGMEDPEGEIPEEGWRKSNWCEG